jgi:predicted RNA-binding Zn-ribbon protein involved in translation (DUF1610 family)
MLTYLAIMAIVSFVGLLTKGSRDKAATSSMATINRCSACGQVVASTVATCRHCGAELLGRSTVASPAAWHSDPYGRHESRYWDGQCWTDNVASGGVTSSDPPV